ncbi:hypothetical protein SUGI_0451130 [Cryptomeria japonica]|nr:hypothetical protein SUGI_0451130 [Cryptomeria japonica]
MLDRQTDSFACQIPSREKKGFTNDMKKMGSGQKKGNPNNKKTMGSAKRKNVQFVSTDISHFKYVVQRFTGMPKPHRINNDNDDMGKSSDGLVVLKPVAKRPKAEEKLCDNNCPWISSLAPLPSSHNTSFLKEILPTTTTTVDSMASPPLLFTTFMEETFTWNWDDLWGET